MSTVRDELEKLLNWYDQYKPGMKGNVVRVYLAPSSVEKFAAKADDGTYAYRGYKILPLNQPKKRAGQP
jgi:hypothetical protein